MKGACRESNSSSIPPAIRSAFQQQTPVQFYKCATQVESNSPLTAKTVVGQRWQVVAVGIPRRCCNIAHLDSKPKLREKHCASSIAHKERYVIRNAPLDDRLLRQPFPQTRLPPSDSHGSGSLTIPYFGLEQKSCFCTVRLEKPNSDLNGLASIFIFIF